VGNKWKYEDLERTLKANVLNIILYPKLLELCTYPEVTESPSFREIY
jgi:hypothetical protein